MSPWLGVIADDYTGATDLAGMLVRSGASVVQFLGVPDEGARVPDVDCLVVALKSRSIPADDAVDQSLAAARWLRAQGVDQLFFKYCSTFDSTADGNIGPVSDALHGEVGAGIAVICPAVPENGRTVYRGQLFVGDKLLSESSMRHHPLNPMTDSDLTRLFEAQSTNRAGQVGHEVVRLGPAAVRARLDELLADGYAFAVVDAIDDDDIRTIGASVTEFPLLTGAAALAVGVAEARPRLGAPQESSLFPLPSGPSAVLSGSCSAATQAQVAVYQAAGHPSFEIDPLKLAAGVDVVSEALDFAGASLADVPLIYSSADPSRVRAIQGELGVNRSAALIEGAFAHIARGLVNLGVRRLIVAGGETSGAVVAGLGVSAIEVGPEVDPGVPWTVSVGEDPIGLLLKSGNFGSRDIFTKALEPLAMGSAS
ncbi:MAG: 3-oxo-tetronate kinase [Mycetocola sp.]